MKALRSRRTVAIIAALVIGAWLGVNAAHACPAPAATTWRSPR